MDDKELIRALLEAQEKKAKRFNAWEQDFLTSIKERAYLSEKQREIALRILSEKSSSTEDKAAAKTDQWDGAEGCERCLDGIVPMRRPFKDTDRSSRFDYSGVPTEMQYHEAAFPCTCDRGALRQQWGKYQDNAYTAWASGWRTPERLMEA